MKKVVYLFLFSSYIMSAQYTGTASVTQGSATTLAANIYTCAGGRVTSTGTIKSSDNKEWTVPAVTNFSNTSFPFASDLHNTCTGANYANAGLAISALSGSDIVSINTDGELITAYIFGDNYFELYINGIPVGKDKVPFTPFNSSIARFKVKRPFTIAMLLVDWEENLGLGSELNGGFAYHPGDGGMVAIFKDSNDKIIAKTGSAWKAQTFYTSPIVNLSCPTENGSKRLSANCSTADSNNGSSYYALHWPRPDNVFNTVFDDSAWPSATTYTNATIGVDNKPAYTNFTNIFDDPTNDGLFIWSTNVVLDNEVIVRYQVPAASATNDENNLQLKVEISPNPAQEYIQIVLPSDYSNSDISEIAILNLLGKEILRLGSYNDRIDIKELERGTYIVKIKVGKSSISKKIILK